jgi:hypothetical protein
MNLGFYKIKLKDGGIATPAPPLLVLLDYNNLKDTQIEREDANAVAKKQELEWWCLLVGY